MAQMSKGIRAGRFVRVYFPWHTSLSPLNYKPSPCLCQEAVPPREFLPSNSRGEAVPPAPSEGPKFSEKFFGEKPRGHGPGEKVKNGAHFVEGLHDDALVPLGGPPPHFRFSFALCLICHTSKPSNTVIIDVTAIFCTSKTAELTLPTRNPLIILQLKSVGTMLN